MTARPPAGEAIGLLAGTGQFPRLIAGAAREAGLRVVAVAFAGEADPGLAPLVDAYHVVKLGQLNRIIAILKEAGVRRAALAGKVSKTNLYARVRPDWRAFKILARLTSRKDDVLLRALADELESEGIVIEPSTLLLPSLLAPEGVLTRRKPNSREREDIAFGWEAARAIGHLDVGQCIVLKDRAVLAIEGMDGTDETIRRGGRLCREGAVVVKAAKPVQDLRFDVPAVGLRTIEVMEEVKARVLVVDAGRTLMFDREAMTDAADRAGISIVAHRGDDARAVPERAPAPAPSPRAAPPLIRAAAPGALRVGVIGCGYFGRFHAQKYARLPEADLVAVADADIGRAKALAESLRTEAVADFRDLIGRVDAVSIATPTPLHHAVALEMLRAGVHVLLEKPMTRTLEEADDLIACAEGSGAILQVGHVERFNAGFRAIEPEVLRPLFIEAHRLAPPHTRGTEVDVILDLMIHDIDIALHLVGAPLSAIRAAGVPVLTSLIDIANVRLEFENGATANLTASRISAKTLRKLRIFQENRYLVVDYATKEARSFRKEAAPDETGLPEITVEDLEVEDRDSLEDEAASFIACAKAGRPPVVDGLQGRRTLAVALEIIERIRERLDGSWNRCGSF